MINAKKKRIQEDYSFTSGAPDQKLQIRNCILYEFKLNKSTYEATKTICSAYGEDALCVRTCQYWFARFRNADFDLNDKDRSGSPTKVDDAILEELLNKDPRMLSRELASVLSVSHVTVCNRLHAMGKVLKMGKWVPHFGS